MEKYYTVDICGRKEDLPIIALPSGISIAFFNLHGNADLTEYCGKKIAERLSNTEIDILITAETKGLQLTHVVARELGLSKYAVVRKSKKLYMPNAIEVKVQSITTKEEQTMYLSETDAKAIKGKRVCIVDDVISTGNSLKAMEEIVNLVGGKIVNKVAVLAEGDAIERNDISYLATIPLL